MRRLSKQRVCLTRHKLASLAGAHDLAVEVISPNETVEEIETKMIDYLEAGTQQVWLVYPRTRSVTVYRSLTDIHAFSVVDTLDGCDLLSGFSIKVQEIFE
jgi:Uma2 family endonuclease